MRIVSFDNARKTGVCFSQFTSVSFLSRSSEKSFVNSVAVTASMLSSRSQDGSADQEDEGDARNSCADAP